MRWRIIRFPKLRKLPPRGLRIECLTKRSAQLDADPRHWVRIVHVQPEDEDARKTDHSHQSQRRRNAYTRDRPEVRNDLRNPPFPKQPRFPLIRTLLLQTVENRTERFDQVHQCRGLLTNLMHQR